MASLVSIVTRTKDRPLLLPRACESVLAQSYPHWEHVIVNDAGEPEVVERIVAPLRDRYGDRLRVLHRTQSSGMEAASNAGIRHGSGTFIAIHDDDDSWHPRFLEKTATALQRLGPESVFQGVVTHCMRIVERLGEGGPREEFRHAFTEGLQPIRLWRVLEENAFPPISFIFRRSAWEVLGPFDESLPVLGDWEFNVRFLQRFEIAVIPEMLAYYHHRSDHSQAVYANTVTAHDHLHRSTEARLIERWSAEADERCRALADATQHAREVLLSRRENDRLADGISTLRAEVAALESHPA